MSRTPVNTRRLPPFVLAPPRAHAHLDLLAMALLVVCCASWGLQQVAVKVALPSVPPLIQAGLRSIVAALLVWAWMVLRRDPVLVRDGTLAWGTAAGLLFTVEFVLIYWGLEFTNASRAVIFLYLSPFVVALGAWLFLPGERLRTVQVVGLACAFSGILVVFGESLALPDRRMLIGDAMLVSAALLWGATTVLIKASPLATASAGRVLLYQLGVSALCLPLGALLLGERWPQEITAVAVASLLYQAVWVAFITYLVWFWLVRHYPAPKLASFTFLAPLFGVAAGGLLLAEPMSPGLLAALVLVATGIWLVNRRPG